jgi:hypothetical protein
MGHYLDKTREDDLFEKETKARKKVLEVYNK